MPTIYSNVSSAADLSADIKAIDHASQASGGNGANYVITLAAGRTLTEAANIDAVNLKAGGALTIDGQGAVLDGADVYCGLFVYAGAVTVENLTIQNAAAVGGAGGFTGDDLGLLVPTSWQIAGTGDFNGDGHSDILWRNANGDADLWKSNGSGGFVGQDLGIVPTSWKIQGA